MDMNGKIDELLERIGDLQDEVEQELHRRRAAIGFHVERGRVRFEDALLETHKALRQRLPTFLRRAELRNILSAPFIYGLLPPLLLFDAAVTLYQQICFRLYGIPRVRRRHHFIIDRGALRYLNAIERVNCVYCGYANGLFSYAREIGARTEQYWCPIKHASRVRDPHPHYMRFIDYGDVQGFRENAHRLRREIRALAEEEARGDGPPPS